MLIPESGAQYALRMLNCTNKLATATCEYMNTRVVNTLDGRPSEAQSTCLESKGVHYLPRPPQL